MSRGQGPVSSQFTPSGEESNALNFLLFQIMNNDPRIGPTDDAVNKFAEFKTADEVAEFLRERGIKGQIGNLNRCPIAEYVNGASGVNCEVDDDSVAVAFNDDAEAKYIMSAAMKEFVQKFDAGDYPDLILEEVK